MNMIEVKTDELAGPALDWAVATANGDNPDMALGGWPIVMRNGAFYRPSESWSHGGPLIDKYEICLICARTGASTTGRTGSGIWSAKLRDLDTDYGHLSQTALIAACRAIVRAKLGDLVQIPA